MICEKENFSISSLIKKAKIKFDWHIDPLKLGSQLLLCKELKDFPKLITPLKESDWQNYFLNEANNLSSEILDPDLKIAEAIDLENLKKISSKF